MFWPIGAHIGAENILLWFFGPQERKYRPKIVLGGDFKSFMVILGKSNFFRFLGSKSP